MKLMLAWALGGWDMIIIVLVILLLFGAKKLPELARGLGQGIKEFKKATREVTDEIQNSVNSPPPPSSPPPSVEPRQIVQGTPADKPEAVAHAGEPKA